MNNNSKVMTALFTGLVSGVAAGFFLAPENGALTRNNLTICLKKITNRLYNYAADQVDLVRFNMRNTPAEIPDDLEHA
ncbi:MAG TPA: YtxH domain-containing protein [Mucilaginibacter sp.]|jgi:gas vesicle protein